MIKSTILNFGTNLFAENEGFTNVILIHARIAD